MKSNAIRIYKHACEMIDNPKGADSLERDLVKKTALKTKEDMEKHFRTAPKYKNDLEIQELIGDLKVKEVKDNGKKSKR